MNKFLQFMLVVGVGGTLTQGFQCSSSKMLAGKSAYGSRDWAKAEKSFRETLATDSTNGEAWYYLSVTQREQGQLDSSVVSLAKARTYLSQSGNSKFLDSASVASFQLWGQYINASITGYNEGVQLTDEAQKQKKLKEALEAAEKAKLLKPERFETIDMLEALYYATGDTVKSNQMGEEYLQRSKSLMEALAKRKTPLGTARILVQDKFGKPDTTFENFYVAEGAGDTVYSSSEYYSNIDGNSGYLYYQRTIPSEDQRAPNTSDDFRLIGGFFNPPKDWLTLEKQRTSPLDPTRFINLAVNYYYQEQYNKALEIIDLVVAVKPEEKRAVQLRTELLRLTGKGEQALQQLEQLIKDEPNVAEHRFQYAAMLSQLERIDDALVQYEKGLAIEPQNEIGLFNSGVIYKNKVRDIQNEEFEKQRADNKYEIKTDRYLPLLKKSTDFFERYRKLPGKRNNIAVMDQLLNNYLVAMDRQNFATTLAEAEAIQAMNEDNLEYYDMMFRIYDYNVKRIRELDGYLSDKRLIESQRKEFTDESRLLKRFDNDTKLQNLVSTVQNLEAKNSSNIEYYRLLLKMYGAMGDTKKMETIDKKIQSMGG